MRKSWWRGFELFFFNYLFFYFFFLFFFFFLIHFFYDRFRVDFGHQFQPGELEKMQSQVLFSFIFEFII